MEVLVGPNFGIEVSPPSAAAAAAYVEINSSSSSPCIFLKEDDEIAVRRSSPIGAPDDSSDSSSSSIGAPDDSEDEEGEEVNSSILSKSGLSCLDALEESLPIKRGLSTHFTGKSKSFANLSDVLMSNSSSSVVTVKDLEKPENPFNKRRRLIMANKWCRKASFYSFSNPKSMPLLTLNELEEEHEQEDDDLHEEDEEDEESQASPSSSSSEHDQLMRNQPRFSKLQEKKFKKSFKSHSCYSLADLQHEEFQ